MKIKGIGKKLEIYSHIEWTDRFTKPKQRYIIFLKIRTFQEFLTRKKKNLERESNIINVLQLIKNDS